MFEEQLFNKRLYEEERLVFKLPFACLQYCVLDEVTPSWEGGTSPIFLFC